MDSPEPSKNKDTSSSASAYTITAAATSSSESPQVQESPFFRYVNNLSPIKPVKTCHVAQGFLGLNSPPLVFTSPRISCHRETQLLERTQCTQTRSREISQSDNGGKSFIQDPDDSKKSSSQRSLPGKFIADSQKVFHIENDANTQHCSSPPCVEDYLADPVDIESNDTVASSQSDLNQSKEIILKCDGKDGPSDESAKPLLLPEESDRFHGERLAHVDEAGKIEGDKKDAEWASQEHTLESNLSADLFEKQHCHDSVAQVVKECEDCGEMVPTAHLSVENMSQDGSEASQKHHGFRRRCLQFEEAASNVTGSNSSPLPVDLPEDSMSSASVSKHIEPSHMTLNVTPSKMKMVKLSEPITSFFPQSGNFSVTCSKPLGIGLHLNSIVNAMPPGGATTTGMRLLDGFHGTKSASSISVHKVENMRKCLISSNLDGQSSVDIGNQSHEIDSSIALDPFVSESPSLTEPIALYPSPTSIHNRRKLSPTDAGFSEEFNQPSPIKKKKRTSNTDDDNGCKRCNCKKSKCLKLYCDCFAAGLYCADSCSCQGCLNRQEHEETVLETRQQIESRNPLAFAPKIVQRATDIQSNNMEDVNLMTPSSARHKRGCNCKRSMCLKKYCECYQANVGCSIGCRCEGCKNTYGRKEDYVATEHALSKERVNSSLEKGSDSTFHNKLEMVASKTKLYDRHRFTPLTPSLQCSDQGNEAAKSRLLSGKYNPSPESDVNPENLDRSLVLGTTEILGNASYDWQMDFNTGDRMDQSSPISDSVANVLQLTPLSNPESMSNASSFSSKTKEWSDFPQAQLCHGSICQLSSGSLRWRTSPITPTTRLGETQFLHGLDTDSGLYDILEDETPDILKEASTPIKSVKTTSPNQKRVSPPQSHVRELGSSTSGGLRSGRKFILKAVPSFPPLTPCIDSKANNGNEDCGNSASK